MPSLGTRLRVIWSREQPLRGLYNKMKITPNLEIRSILNNLRLQVSNSTRHGVTTYTPWGAILTTGYIKYLNRVLPRGVICLFTQFTVFLFLFFFLPLVRFTYFLGH
jgi:hypothetical protein